jgi:oligosaccharide 4-alpha-D-glucosyltransferase
MLGMSMSGIPYIHADAGGFAGGEGDNELYIRWLQFASFTPVFRPHGTALYEVDKNAFSFPSEPAMIAAPYRNYAKEVVRQRYAMLPYNYTLAYKQALKAEPLVAPLYYHFPNDTNAYHAGDEFMWGESILVAPILEKAAAGRKLYLPIGNWYANDGNERIAGGNDTTVKVIIDKLPVYVRAGSFITTNANQNVTSTSDDQLDNLVVNYYYDTRPSTTEIYDDDGFSKNSISARQYQVITFSALPAKSKLALTVKANGGTFKGMPAKRKMKFLVHGVINPKATLFKNGKPVQELSLQENEDGSKANCYTFTVDFTGKPLQLEIR